MEITRVNCIVKFVIIGTNSADPDHTASKGAVSSGYTNLLFHRHLLDSLQHFKMNLFHFRTISFMDFISIPIFRFLTIYARELSRDKDSAAYSV